MIKVDWWSALGGVVVGYYAKGKVDQVKSKVRSIINTNASEDLKSSFGDPQATQAQTGWQAGVGQSNG